MTDETGRDWSQLVPILTEDEFRSQGLEPGRGAEQLKAAKHTFLEYPGREGDGGYDAIVGARRDMSFVFLPGGFDHFAHMGVETALQDILGPLGQGWVMGPALPEVEFVYATPEFTAQRMQNVMFAFSVVPILAVSNAGHHAVVWDDDLQYALLITDLKDDPTLAAVGSLVANMDAAAIMESVSRGGNAELELIERFGLMG